jgi:glutamate mutase epsilon subunit
VLFVVLSSLMASRMGVLKHVRERGSSDFLDVVCALYTAEVRYSNAGFRWCCTFSRRIDGQRRLACCCHGTLLKEMRR